MPDMMKLVKQAMTVQKDMKKARKQLAAKRVEFTEPKGKVTVTAGGDGTIRNVRIDPGIVDPSNTAALEKAVLAAVDGALAAAKEETGREMARITRGMDVGQLRW
jgi:DNA-binding YbaB/EbfC family protein